MLLVLGGIIIWNPLKRKNLERYEPIWKRGVRSLELLKKINC